MTKNASRPGRRLIVFAILILVLVFRPQGLLAFKVDQGTVREQIRRWFGSKWLAPNNLKSRALVDRVHGVYIPYWTFEAQAVLESRVWT